MKLHPYLNFNGNTEEAFNFYKTVFGGDFTMVFRFKDTPDSGNLSEADKNKIMHISLPIGENIMLLGTDALESMGQKLVQGNNFYLYVDTKSEEEASNIYNKLAEGGQIEMPLQKTFWGAFYGSFKDKFGIGWMVSYTYPMEHKE